MNKQKAKFNGEVNQIFTIGTDMFPSNVWKFISPLQLIELMGGNAYKKFSFSPPVDFDSIKKPKDLPTKKAKKRKTKSKKEE